MQFIPAILAASAALFACASAEVEQHGHGQGQKQVSRASRPQNKDRQSHGSPTARRSRASASPKHHNPSIIGGDSSVWGPSLSGSSSCGRSSRSSRGCSSSSWGSSSNGCYDPCYNPCYNPCLPGAANPFIAAPCAAPCAAPYVAPCASPCASPCAPLACDAAGVQPWYIYLTATQTVISTSSVSFTSEVLSEVSTVAYRVFALTSEPTAYYAEDPLGPPFNPF